MIKMAQPALAHAICPARKTHFAWIPANPEAIKLFSKYAKLKIEDGKVKDYKSTLRGSRNITLFEILTVYHPCLPTYSTASTTLPMRLYRPPRRLSFS